MAYNGQRLNFLAPRMLRGGAEMKVRRKHAVAHLRLTEILQPLNRSRVSGHIYHILGDMQSLAQHRIEI